MLIPAFLVSSWAIFLLIDRIFSHQDILNRSLATLFYFTTQSNILVWVVLIFCFTRLTNRKWFRNLSFIALIDIIITSLIFNLFLASFLDHIEIMQHVLHTIVPIIYVIFYILFLSEKRSYKTFYISLFHPLVFLFSVYLFIEPFFGNSLNVIYPDHDSGRFIYPFLDPNNYASGIFGLTLFIVGVLTPFIALTSLVMIYITARYHDYIITKINKKLQ